MVVRVDEVDAATDEMYGLFGFFGFLVFWLFY
jgi:hypothetical protein